MRALLLAPLAALTLAACIDVDMNVEVLGEDQARVTGSVQMSRQMFDMSGGDTSFCDPEDGGTLSMTDTHMRCDFDKTGTFAELGPNDQDQGAMEMATELTYLGDDRVRLFIPMGMMNDELDDAEDDPQMLEMMKQIFAGASIRFTVSGREIESSTAPVSDDGRSTSLILGVDELFAPADQRISDFEAVVRY